MGTLSLVFCLFYVILSIWSLVRFKWTLLRSLWWFIACTMWILGFIVRLFSVMLIYFEMGLGKYEEFIRKYFGFMYSYMGRTIFTLLDCFIWMISVVLSLWFLEGGRERVFLSWTLSLVLLALCFAFSTALLCVSILLSRREVSFTVME